MKESKETAGVMLRHVFRLHGFPKDVVSDQGLQFASQFWNAFLLHLGRYGQPYVGVPSPVQWPDRTIEPELEMGLCALVSQNPTKWNRHLIWVEYAHNTLPCSSSGVSPFQCAYGYQPPLFPALEEEVIMPSAQSLIHH